jgi:hypothetical protein
MLFCVGEFFSDLNSELNDYKTKVKTGIYELYFVLISLISHLKNLIAKNESSNNYLHTWGNQRGE